MELTKAQKFRMTQTATMTNMKELAGKTMKPIYAQMSGYTKNNEKHTVLAVLMDDGNMYRTEGRAFIESFNDYWGVFADDDDRPSITIKAITGKRGNPYLNMEVNC